MKIGVVRSLNLVIEYVIDSKDQILMQCDCTIYAYERIFFIVNCSH